MNETPETPEEPKLVQLIEQKLSALPPEKRSELMAKIWQMIDEELKPKSD